MNLGEQLKQYRKENQLSQKQLAEQLFVTDKAISKWETDKGYPDLNMLPKIAQLLDTTVDDLLSERTSPNYYEYKSGRQILGKPLIHIVLPTFRRYNPYNNLFINRKLLMKRKIPQANGVIAIGVSAKGLISIGLITRGLLSLGVLSIGLLSVGVLAIGVVATGNTPIGIFALGNIAFGLFVLGNIAMGVFASGDLTIGWTAIGNQSYGAHSFSLGDDYTAEMYQVAVTTLHEKIQQPIVDAFYNMNIWLAANPIFIVCLAFLSVLLFLFEFLIVYLKRHKLFFDY
ncbi:hypothetical protein BAU15_08165 [Enterococcus sp. JM4C]|uniref:helix-turn-helix domain-containing protein n=1 Tax=Candidatus Enterococcus huntleyi TaxID=1857217 RepID=UPI001379B7F4|nr:helix-turn-helix domain-containing protein [Enterococcus sp. JM4C]KAF1297870.1 hypothetical protein BAU15_08165 [Enterococcus sp. JM4C]